MIFPSKLIEDAVGEVSKLPGIGKKTALRLVLHLLKQDEKQTVGLSEALLNLRQKTTYCKRCHNVSDAEFCNICSNPKRDPTLLCVVADLPDVLAIENTAQFRGLYHILGGVVSPLEGIGPNDLKIESLIERVAENEVKEIILALSPTMEGDNTAFYLTKRLKQYPVKISTIARGIPIGGELEFADEITLGRSIVTRIVYE
jgi:recombination protein RecR